MIAIYYDFIFKILVTQSFIEINSMRNIAKMCKIASMNENIALGKVTDLLMVIVSI